MTGSEILRNVFFYLLAASAVGGAAAVAASRNIVRSAFALLVMLFSAGALYALMKADFIAAAQVLIYVGGILVLIIFAVMLTHRITDVNISNESSPGPAAFFACLCLLFSLVVVILSYGRWERDAEPLQAEVDGAREKRRHALELRQYQADGRTGLAWGTGATFERRVALSVRVPQVLEGAEAVKVEVAGVPGWKGAVQATALVVDGIARVAVPLEARDGPLPEEVHWRAKVTAATGDLTGWTRKDDDDETDFKAYGGITEPVARAFMGPYLLAFEAVSVLLLAALVGAAYLARKEVKE